MRIKLLVVMMLALIISNVSFALDETQAYKFTNDALDALNMVDYGVDAVEVKMDEKDMMGSIVEMLEGMHLSTARLGRARAYIEPYVSSQDPVILVLSTGILGEIDAYIKTNQVALALFSSQDNFDDQMKVVSILSQINADRKIALRDIMEIVASFDLLLYNIPEEENPEGKMEFRVLY